MMQSAQYICIQFGHQNVALVCYQISCRELQIVDLKSVPWRSKKGRRINTAEQSLNRELNRYRTVVSIEAKAIDRQ